MQGKVEICGVNTSKLKSLMNDEMMELLQRSKRGDQAARQRLVAAAKTRMTCFRWGASVS